jgi:hypothetical protein
MIDTLRLNITDCIIDGTTPLVIEPSPYQHDTQQRFINYDLFVDSEGELVQGRKAYLNRDKFNITIKPKYKLQTDEINKKKIMEKKLGDGSKVHYLHDVEIPAEDFNAGIFVQTSLPRYLNTNNFSAINISDEKKVLKQLEKDLWSEGIKTNIWNANLSRIDMFANLNTDENFINYSGIFDLMELSRMKKFEYAGTTFLYRNGEHQICCYDKIEEMNNKIKDFKTPKRFDNIMRIENRLLKKRKILDVSGFDKLNQLFKNYDFIKKHYRNKIGETVFKYEPDEFKNKMNKMRKETVELLNESNDENYSIEALAESMKYFFESKKRGWLQRYAQTFGIGFFFSKVKFKGMLKAIEKMDLSRMQKSRAIRFLYYARNDVALLNPYLSVKTNLQLYNELKTKFYKAVA